MLLVVMLCLAHKIPDRLKAIDLLAYNPETKRTFVVQVKSLRSKNFFLISRDKVESGHVYVFVLLNRADEQVQYFIVPGTDLCSDPAKFSKWFTAEKMPGIHSNLLIELGYENAWGLFHAAADN